MDIYKIYHLRFIDTVSRKKIAIKKIIGKFQAVTFKQSGYLNSFKKYNWIFIKSNTRDFTTLTMSSSVEISKIMGMAQLVIFKQ